MSFNIANIKFNRGFKGNLCNKNSWTIFQGRPPFVLTIEKPLNKSLQLICNKLNHSFYPDPQTFRSLLYFLQFIMKGNGTCSVLKLSWNSTGHILWGVSELNLSTIYIWALKIWAILVIFTLFSYKIIYTFQLSHSAAAFRLKTSHYIITNAQTSRTNQSHQFEYK